MQASTYRRYLLAVLLVILAFNYVDRLALGLLAQNIKADLNLTDTQLGLLSGIAFAAFYSLMGIPIARWADRGNRVRLIAWTAGLWSAAVALCGVATSLFQLLLIRIGVAVGEAGCIPPAHSLIADYFSRAERPRAVAIYMLGVPLSAVIGNFLAGWLNELYGWRITFMLLGLPGIFLGVLAYITLKEPRRARPPQWSREHAEPYVQMQPLLIVPTNREVCATLWATITFRHLLVCLSVSYFFGYGITQWQPAFFIRSYGMSTGELGTWFAVIWGAGGLLGTYWGGEWASRYAVHNERLQLKMMALGYTSFGVLSAFIYLSTNRYVGFALMTLAAIGLTATIGPLFAMTQSLVPVRMRAIAVAIIYLFANLLGMGLGPLAVGILSDALQPLFGDESLRYALLALCPGYLWCAWHLLRGRKTVAEDLRCAQERVDAISDPHHFTPDGVDRFGSSSSRAFLAE